MMHIGIVVGVAVSILFCPVKTKAGLVEVQNKVLSDSAQVIKEAEAKREQRKDWVKKNKKTEQHFINTLKSFDEHVAAGTEAKTDEERIKWSPMKKLMNRVLKDELDNRKSVLSNDPANGCSFHGGPAYNRTDYLVKKRMDYPEIAEWLDEKGQFCEAIDLYGKAYLAGYGSDPGDILDAWEEYGKIFSIYPEFPGFYIWYYAATKYITDGKAPENLQLLLKREGLLEVAETRYQEMKERFGTISEVNKKVQAQAAAMAKNMEWRTQVMSQIANAGSLTARVVESKLDFMPVHYEAKEDFMWGLKHIQVGEPPKQTTVYPDGVFYVLSVEIKNIGKQDLVLNTQQFQLVDSKGRKFKIHKGAQAALKSIGKSIIKTVFAGSSANGLLAFDVPKPIPQGLILKVQADGGDNTIYLHWRKPKKEKPGYK